MLAGADADAVVSYSSILTATDLMLAGADADADGITNNRDNCQQTYNPSQANFDDDTQGDICDSDDDGEGIPDVVDSCPMGALLWTSNTSTDYDTDGCKDDIEDADDVHVHQPMHLSVSMPSPKLPFGYPTVCTKSSNAAPETLQ